MEVTNTFRSNGYVTGIGIDRGGVRLCRVAGFFNGTTNANFWIQFHTTSYDINGNIAAPSVGSVPVFSALLQQTFEFAETFPGCSAYIPGPVYAIVSSAEDTYQAADASNKVDLFLELSASALPLMAKTVASVTDVASTIVFASGSGHSLYDLIATCKTNDTNTYYLQVFSSAPSAGAIPLHAWALPVYGQGALQLCFSSTSGPGYIPYTHVGNVNSYGCILAISSTPATYTASGTFSAITRCF